MCFSPAAISTFHCSSPVALADYYTVQLQVEPHPRDFGRSLGAALDFNFQEHMGMLNQLVGLMGALPVHQEDSPLMTFKRFVQNFAIQICSNVQLTLHCLA